MSCTTQNTQPVKFVVSMGSLPEGFCGTPQELAQAIADRLIITPDIGQSSFATGSTAPTSNVGPWFKNCEEWFVWDDDTATYIPITKGGFNTVELFDASGTYVVPVGIYKLKLEAWGGGGGGHEVEAGPVGGAGGGGGGYACKIFSVTPGQSIPFVVGTGGTSGAPGTDGGDTTFLTVTANGGDRGMTADICGIGGVQTGGDFGVVGSSGTAGNSSVPGTGGDAGGPGGAGGQYVANIAAATTALPNGAIPGGGGAGGKTGLQVAGTGAHGRVIIWT